MTFKRDMQTEPCLVGTFMKTPSYELIEVLAVSGLDFLCLDAEHAPFDRARLDACLAVAKALHFPTLVRIADSAPSTILQALDAGATGLVVPHVDSAQKAATVAKAAQYGHGGRGYAGSTRAAGFATQPMKTVLQHGQDNTVVIAQIEEPEGVDAIDEIAAIDGIDGLFIGPADLAVCYGTQDQSDPRILDAMSKAAAAAKRHGKVAMTFVGNASQVEPLRQLGLTLFFIGSDHAFMRNMAVDQARIAKG